MSQQLTSFHTFRGSCKCRYSFTQFYTMLRWACPRPCPCPCPCPCLCQSVCVCVMCVSVCVYVCVCDVCECVCVCVCVCVLKGVRIKHAPCARLFAFLMKVEPTSSIRFRRMSHHGFNCHIRSYGAGHSDRGLHLVPLATRPQFGAFIPAHHQLIIYSSSSHYLLIILSSSSYHPLIIYSPSSHDPTHHSLTHPLTNYILIYSYDAHAHAHAHAHAMLTLCSCYDRSLIAH